MNTKSKNTANINFVKQLIGGYQLAKKINEVTDCDEFYFTWTEPKEDWIGMHHINVIDNALTYEINYDAQYDDEILTPVLMEEPRYKIDLFAIRHEHDKRRVGICNQEFSGVLQNIENTIKLYKMMFLHMRPIIHMYIHIDFEKFTMKIGTHHDKTFQKNPHTMIIYNCQCCKGFVKHYKLDNIHRVCANLRNFILASELDYNSLCFSEYLSKDIIRVILNVAALYFYRSIKETWFEQLKKV